MQQQQTEGEEEGGPQYSTIYRGKAPRNRGKARHMMNIATPHTNAHHVRNSHTIGVYKIGSRINKPFQATMR